MPTVVPLIFQSACLMLLNKSSCTTLMIPHTELLRTVFKILQHIASQSMKSKSWISELTVWAAATHQCIIYFKLTLADVKWCQCDHRHVLTIKPKLGSLDSLHTNLWRSRQWSIRAMLLPWIIFHRFDELKCNQLSGRANVTRFVVMSDSFISLLISFPLLWAAGNSSQLPFFLSCYPPSQSLHLWCKCWEMCTVTWRPNPIFLIMLR